MARPARLTRDQHAAQRAITATLQTAHENRRNAARYATCIDYAARTIEAVRKGIDLVDRKTDRAWRD